MDGKEKSPVYVIGGLSSMLLGGFTLFADIPETVEWFRQMTGLNWQWWNVLLIVVGLSTAIYGVWLRSRKTKLVEGDEGETVGDRYSIFLVPIVYPIIWIQRFDAWANAGKEGDPVRAARQIVFMFGAGLLLIIGLFFAFLALFGIYSGLMWCVAQFICEFEQSCVDHLMNDLW